MVMLNQRSLRVIRSPSLLAVLFGTTFYQISSIYVATFCVLVTDKRFLSGSPHAGFSCCSRGSHILPFLSLNAVCLESCWDVSTSDVNQRLKLKQPSAVDRTFLLRERGSPRQTCHSETDGLN